MEPDFHVPIEALEYFRSSLEKGKNAEEQWVEKFERIMKKTSPDHPPNCAEQCKTGLLVVGKAPFPFPGR